MKSIKRYFFVMMAIAAVFGFVACSDDDDDDGASVMAVYKDDTVYTATFYGNGNNGNFDVIMKVDSYTEKEAEGIYTGDPSKDGEITMTYTFIDNFESSKGFYESVGIALNKAVTVKITSGKCDILGSAYTRQK